MDDQNHPPGARPTGPAGWYPQPDGTQRYWDGTAWTHHTAPGSAPTGEDVTMAVLAHVLNVIATVIGPLVIYLVKKDASPFVRAHSVEALNFGITLVIAYTVAGALAVLLVGLVLLPVIFVLQIVFTIMAASAAGRGVTYQYPVAIRFIS